MNTVAEYVDELDRKIDELNEMRRVMMATIGPDEFPDTLPEWAYLFPASIVSGNNLRIDIPFDLSKLAKIRKIIGKGWKFSDRMKHKDDGDVTFFYTNKGTHCLLRIVLIADHPDATCKRVKVGEKVESIYEVICN